MLESANIFILVTFYIYRGFTINSSRTNENICSLQHTFFQGDVFAKFTLFCFVFVLCKSPTRHTLLKNKNKKTKMNLLARLFEFAVAEHTSNIPRTIKGRHMYTNSLNMCSVLNPSVSCKQTREIIQTQPDTPKNSGHLSVCRADIWQRSVLASDWEKTSRWGEDVDYWTNSKRRIFLRYHQHGEGLSYRRSVTEPTWKRTAELMAKIAVCSINLRSRRWQGGNSRTTQVPSNWFRPLFSTLVWGRVKKIANIKLMNVRWTP